MFYLWVCENIIDCLYGFVPATLLSLSLEVFDFSVFIKLIWELWLFFSNSYVKIFHFLILLHWLTVQVCTEVVIADLFIFFLILKGKLIFHYCYIGNLFLLDFLYLK